VAPRRERAVGLRGPDDDQHEPARALLTGEATVATLDLAFYEVGDLAVRAWGDAQAAARLRGLVVVIADDGGLVRLDEPLIARAVDTAHTEGLSVYDAGYVAAAARAGGPVGQLRSARPRGS
jgi:predicted nucleic acid-binding protein